MRRGLWFVWNNRLVSAGCAFWWENLIRSALDSCHMFHCATSRFMLYCGILIIRLIYWSVTHVANRDPVISALVSFTFWSAAEFVMNLALFEQIRYQKFPLNEIATKIIFPFLLLWFFFFALFFYFFDFFLVF